MAVFGQPQQQSFFQQAAAPQAPQDFKIPAPGPTDGITSISFSRNNQIVEYQLSNNKTNEAAQEFLMEWVCYHCLNAI